MKPLQQEEDLIFVFYSVGGYIMRYRVIFRFFYSRNGYDHYRVLYYKLLPLDKRYRFISSSAIDLSNHTGVSALSTGSTCPDKYTALDCLSNVKLGHEQLRFLSRKRIRK